MTESLNLAFAFVETIFVLLKDWVDDGLAFFGYDFNNIVFQLITHNQNQDKNHNQDNHLNQP